MKILFLSLSITFSWHLVFANNSNCGNRSNQLSSQLTSFERLQQRLCESNSEFCGQLQQTALVGPESARVVSKDPNSEEAQIAESNGPVVFCGQNRGALSLYTINDRTYLIGAAHSFYNEESGEQHCSDTTAKVFLDNHYYGEGGPQNIDGTKFYEFNVETLVNENNRFNTNPENDFVIFDVTDVEGITTNQLGRERQTLSLATESNEELIANYSRNPNTVFISKRLNYENSIPTVIEMGQNITTSASNNFLKYSFDTGGLSSGASLISKNNDELLGLGIDIGSNKERYDQSTADKSGTMEGNLFLPASRIWEALEEKNIYRNLMI